MKPSTSLSLFSLLGTVVVSSSSVVPVRWNDQNCEGIVVDAVCCGDRHCDELKREIDCHSDSTCLWKSHGDDGSSNGTCLSNRDDLNNVCCLNRDVNQFCVSATRGLCPTDHQVPSGCCSRSGMKWDGILSVNRTGYVCCNTPCRDMELMKCQAPPRCHERSIAGLNSRYFGFRDGLLGPKNVLGQIFPFPGNYFPGTYGYGDVYAGQFPGQGIHDDDYSADLHADEITVDDLMNSLIDALSSDNDVFSYNEEITSDPLFRKEKYGGFVDQFNFIDPYYFIDSIYGLPLTYGGGEALIGGAGTPGYGYGFATSSGYGLNRGYGIKNGWGGNHGGWNSNNRGYGNRGGWSSNNRGYDSRGWNHRMNRGSPLNNGWGSNHRGWDEENDREEEDRRQNESSKEWGKEDREYRREDDKNSDYK